MAINSGALNSHAINASVEAQFHFRGVLSDEQFVGIEQAVVSNAEVFSKGINQRVFETGTLSVGVQQVNTETIYVVSASIAQELFGKEIISQGISQTNFGATDGTGVTPSGTVIPPGLNSSPDEGSYWTAKVILAGLDISANLTGVISVDNEESAASVATFTIKPTAGVVDLTQWVRAVVRISYIKTTPAGASLGEFLLFNGFVDVPSYDATTRLTTFTCTDELQRAFENLTTAQIDAAVGGWWSNEVFEEDTDKWSYSQDRLSTQPASLNYDVNRALVKTPWAAKVTADFLLNESVILDGSIGVDLANSREILNYVELAVSYDYEAFKSRQVKYFWTMKPSVESGNFSPYGWKPVTNGMVLDAATEGSWVFAGKPSFTPWPPSAFYHGVAVINAGPQMVVGAIFSSVKRYQQSISDAYTIVLQSPKSVASLGKLPVQEEYNMAAEYSEEIDGFEETTIKTGTYIAELNTLFAEDIVDNEPIAPSAIGEIEIVYEYPVYANDFSERAVLGETEYDFSAEVSNNTRADFEGFLDVVQNLHKTNILASHRGNSVSIVTLIEPNITREVTVRVETDAVVAQGKVRQVTHTMDIQAGTATSEIVLGISRSTALGIVDVETPLDSSTIAPEVLATPTVSNGVVDNYARLGNYVQRIPNSNQLGDNAFGMQAFYNETEFLVNFPEISTENAELLSSTTDQNFVVEVPNEDLTLNA